MNAIDTYTLDLLRVLETLEPTGRFYPVKQLIPRFYQGIIPIRHAPAITSILLERGWVFGVEEEDAVQINDSGSAYLSQTITEDYILDRMFYYLLNALSPDIISEMARKLQFKLDKDQAALLSAQIEDSGLVDVKPFGYHSSFKINAKGTVILNKYDSYSAYQRAREVPMSSNIQRDDISELSVLQAFVKHGQLSWPDFSIKTIFGDIAQGTARAGQLGDWIRSIRDRGFIDEFPDPPPTWRINSRGHDYYEQLCYSDDETIAEKYMTNSTFPETFELIFQHHLANQGTLTWHKETLKPNVPDNWQSAREMMIEKGVLIWVGSSKIKRTALHPDILLATSYAEAASILSEHRRAAPINVNTQTIHARDITGSNLEQASIRGQHETIPEKKENIPWYKKTVFLYIVWPVVVAVIVALILWLTNLQ